MWCKGANAQIALVQAIICACSLRRPSHRGYIPLDEYTSVLSNTGRWPRRGSRHHRRAAAGCSIHGIVEGNFIMLLTRSSTNHGARSAALSQTNLVFAIRPHAMGSFLPAPRHAPIVLRAACRSIWGGAGPASWFARDYLIVAAYAWSARMLAGVALRLRPRHKPF